MKVETHFGHVCNAIRVGRLKVIVSAFVVLLY